MAKHEPVLFENSLGETISNDPFWLAEQLLANSDQAGVEDDKDARIAELEAQLAATAPATPPTDDDEVEDDEDDEDKPRDYKELTGKPLANYAKERGLVLKNEDGTNKKVSEVRAELIALDAAPEN